MAGTDIHAVACAVPMDARDLVRPDRFEYADAFVVTLPPRTRIAAEDWARAMFMPRGLAQQALAGAWNAVMGLEPPSNGSAMGPFQVLSDQRESAILVGEGERYRIRLVVLAREGSLTLATFVQSRGRAWRELLRGILVGHRRVAPLLLERAVARKARNHRSASEEPAQDDIRPCPPERLEEVISLWREAETEPTVTDDVKSLERLLAADPGALLVAIEDDRVIGTLVAAWNGWRGSLYRLAVLPGWRRRGVAMRLLRAGEERLMGLGAKRIDAVVLADNAHALAFWRAAGYTRQRGRARLVKNSPL